MEIKKTTQSFGMKIPVKTAIESAAGCFLDDAKYSYPRQCNLLEQVSGLKVKDLYAGEVADGMRNLSKYLRAKFPALAETAANIKKVCDEINAERTFLPEDEQKISKILQTLWNNEAKKFKTKDLDIDKISLKELGLDKYM